MLSNFVDAMQRLIASAEHEFLFVMAVIIVFWIVHIVNSRLQYRLNYLGIYPRSFTHLIGILFFSFLHGDYEHLFLNTIPLFVLINLVLLQGRYVFYAVSVLIILISGLAIWLFAKKGIHVGASSLIMGYFGYLLANVFFQPSAMAIILLAVCLYYIGGGLLLTLFSFEKNVSFEGHLFGLLSGVAVAFIMMMHV